MRRTQRGWDPSFFWQFVNGTHGTTDCLKRVVPLVTPVFSTRSSPCCWRHSLPPFLIACGRPNQERSSLPPLTVLPLLTGEHQEEGEWVEKTRVQTSGSGRHPGVFFLSVGRGNLGIFPCLTEEACSPTAPLPFRQNSIRRLGH